MDRPFPLIAILLGSVFCGVAHAARPPLLAEAVRSWAAGADDWAFTQRVRTFDNDKLKLERLERYDPSRPDNRRWELLSIDGRTPTEAERDRWQHRKNRKPRKTSEKTIEEYLDFERASVSRETEEAVRYDVPVHKEASRLLPVEK